jgi:hypothetical protein
MQAITIYAKQTSGSGNQSYVFAQKNNYENIITRKELPVLTITNQLA